MYIKRIACAQKVPRTISEPLQLLYKRLYMTNTDALFKAVKWSQKDFTTSQISLCFLQNIGRFRLISKHTLLRLKPVLRWKSTSIRLQHHVSLSLPLWQYNRAGRRHVPVDFLNNRSSQDGNEVTWPAQDFYIYDHRPAARRCALSLSALMQV